MPASCHARLARSSAPTTFQGDIVPLREMQRRYASWAFEALGARRTLTAERSMSTSRPWRSCSKPIPKETATKAEITQNATATRASISCSTCAWLRAVVVDAGAQGIARRLSALRRGLNDAARWARADGRRIREHIQHVVQRQAQVLGQPVVGTEREGVDSDVAVGILSGPGCRLGVRSRNSAALAPLGQ